MKNFVLAIILMCIPLSVFSQKKITEKRKFRFPIWVTHDNNVDVFGVSLAAFPKETFKRDTTLARTYGIRLEVSLISVFSPLMGRSPISTSIEGYELKQSLKPNEIINGFNISSGTFGRTTVNGISSALFIQYLYILIPNRNPKSWV